jgi:RNA polymerase sigma factor for flagellar operon FliA
VASQEFGDLWERWKKARDEASREAILEAYLPLVQRLFSRVRIGLARDVGDSLGEDLKHAGVIGLMEAFDHYHEGRDASFSTFATYRIRGAMLDELRRQDWLSKGCRHRLKEIQKACALAEQALGRAASEEEIARQLKISPEQLREELMDVGPATLLFLDGLKNPDGSLEGTRGADRLPDKAAVSPDEPSQRQELASALAGQIERLPEQERRVLTLLVHDELGQKEISEVLGLSRSRVSQIYARAVIRLQAALLPLFES